jgi:hypothetical protein
MIKYKKKKNAEEEGFEPPIPFSMSVFKTDAIDHSAIPLNFYTTYNRCNKHLMSFYCPTYISDISD